MSFPNQYDFIANSIASAALRSRQSPQQPTPRQDNPAGSQREAIENAVLGHLNEEVSSGTTNNRQGDIGNSSLSSSPSRNHGPITLPSSATISSAVEARVPEMSLQRIQMARLAAAGRAVASASTAPRRGGNRTIDTPTSLCPSLPTFGYDEAFRTAVRPFPRALGTSFQQQENSENKHSPHSNSLLPSRTEREQRTREETHRELVEKLLLVQREKELQLERIEELKTIEELRRKRLMRAGVVTQAFPNFALTTEQLPRPTMVDLSGEPSPCRWWVCSHCQSRAFSDRSEARDHEAVCEKNSSKRKVSAEARPSDESPKLQGQKQDVEISRQDHRNKFRPSQNSQNPESNDCVTPELPPIKHASSHVMCIPLSTPDDQKFISPFECFVRCHCVRVFADVAADTDESVDKRAVSLRCPYCPGKSRGSVFFPPSLANLYNDSMKLLQGHVAYCPSLPRDVAAKYRSLLRTARPGYDAVGRRYWIESAKSVGLKDSPGGGVCFELDYSNRESKLGDVSLLSSASSLTDPTRGRGRDTNEPEGREPQGETKQGSSRLNSRIANSSIGHKSEDVTLDNTPKKTDDMPSLPSPDPTSLVQPEDSSTSTCFSYFLLSQMRRCSFTEADRLGKRKGLPVGFSGLACRHCYGGCGAGRFFPSTLKTLSDTSKTLNVLHNHMMRCRSCPISIKETLGKLRARHDEERARLKFGSQKAFFARIWSRLHEKSSSPGSEVHSLTSDGGASYDQQNALDLAARAPTAVDGVAALSLAALHIAGMKRLFPSSQTSSPSSIPEGTTINDSATPGGPPTSNDVSLASSPSKPAVKRPRAA